jgi:hypothetical protein
MDEIPDSLGYEVKQMQQHTFIPNIKTQGGI